MCGINGFNFKDEPLAAQMNERIKHRGPDGDGVFSTDIATLGHVRLSILDLSESGAQPMQFDGLSITYNGEIYNFQELKEELKNLGHHFVSGTDTEVLLHAYREWGQDFVNRLNGMWAFCIFDTKSDKLFLSRDRFGIKPIYYYHQDNRFIFSSEIKAIRVHQPTLTINTIGLNYYFYQKYIGNDHTIFREIKKLKAGHNLIYHLRTNKLEAHAYYDVKEAMGKVAITADTLHNKIKEDLNTAVKDRLIADVPVGCFLSGGVDSSVISAIIAKEKTDLKTFTIGFKEASFDEVEFSKQVSEHIKTEHIIDYLEIDKTVIEKVISHLDEPFGDASILPTYLLSKLTRSHVTVALSGDAADELFGGYDSYYGYVLAEKIPAALVKMAKPFASFIPADQKKLSAGFKIKKFFNDYHTDPQRRHLNWMSQFNENDREELLSDNYLSNEQTIPIAGKKNLTGIQLNDVANYLDGDILKKVDIASMMNSLETRVPFLDYRVVPKALKLPDYLKIDGKVTKVFLKQFAESLIPSSIVHRKKRGFSVPIAKWLATDKYFEQYLIQDEAFAHGFLNQKFVNRLFNEHKSGKADRGRQLWLIFVFNLWWEKNQKGIDGI